MKKQYPCGTSIRAALEAERDVLQWDTFLTAIHWAGLDDSFNSPNSKVTLQLHSAARVLQ